MVAQQTLGDYLRELRKKKEWTLLKLSEVTQLSYPHLSRIENDSAVPTPQTVVTLAEALGGDLNLMLELADCLPKQILDRLVSRPETRTLKRTAGAGSKQSSAPDARAAALARALDVPDSEVDDVADAIVRFLKLDSRRRRAVVQLMKSFDGGGGGQR